jgi:long-chain fatty acid transport protein
MHERAEDSVKKHHAELSERLPALTVLRQAAVLACTLNRRGVKTYSVRRPLNLPVRGSEIISLLRLNFSFSTQNLRRNQMDRTLLKWSFSIFLVTVPLLCSQNSFAGGAYLPEIATPGSVGTAGVANVTNVDDASSAFTNPAGMTYRKNDEAQAGMEVLIPVSKFDSDIATAGGSDGGNAGNPAVIPGFFVVKGLNENLKLGFSIAAVAGGGLDYGENFVGRYQAYKAVLQTVGLGPSLGYKINDMLSIGAGVYMIHTTYNQKTAVNQSFFGANDGTIQFQDINDIGYQWNAGIIFQPTDRLLFGFTYLSEADVKLSGDLKTSGLQGAFDNLLGDADSITVDFDFPEALTFGLRYRVTDKLTLLADSNYQRWSQFSQTNVRIDVGPTGDVVTTGFDRDWKDTWHAGAAFKYDLGENHLMAMGVSYDSSPVTNKDRTADLPLDEQFRIAAAFAKKNPIGFSYSVSGSWVYFGEGKMDQTVQGERYKGKFDTNYLVFIAASVKYQF